MQTSHYIIIQIYMISHLAGFYRRRSIMIIIGDQNDSIHRIESIVTNTCLYLVKVVLFENPELNYHFNMNVDQSTRALPTICTCKNVIWIFLTQPMKYPLYFCVIYFTMIEVGKMNLFWVLSEGIYFVNLGSKVITSRKYIYIKIIYL